MATTAEIREILCPTDLSLEAHLALRHAQLLARRFEARLTIYHAAPEPEHAQAHWAFAHESEVWRRAEREARHLIEAEVAGMDVPCRVEVERAVSPPRAILERVRSTRPDLVVMATHGHEGLRHALVGSVTEEVFRHAFRPVLCVREPDHQAALPYRRVLVPTDMTPEASHAFPMAARIARAFAAEVIGLHIRGGQAGGAKGAAEPPTERALQESLWEDFQGLAVTARVREGEAWEGIRRAASEERADLVVMSTRGHDSLSDMVLGSTTERVVRHAPCPVLVA